MTMTFFSCVDKHNSEVNLSIQEVPFTNVRFTDNFWAPRIETNRTVSIPSAFHQCEINGRF
ncbi:MAG: glycoside hydrolase family 127 protein, partial [Tannerella sp.]|nr:glycoside hydrolase family 127 protein [Tannerella sp.]